MDTLWAPWRMAYIDRSSREKNPACIFCSRIARRRDPQDLIVFRAKLGTVFMNRFPYNNGHLMVMPNRHLARLSELNRAEILELHRLLELSLHALDRAMHPDGYNLGLNLGLVAGAGVPGHLHWHLVPRWQGDTSFMPVLAETKVMPEHLRATWKKLRAAFAEGSR